LGSRSYLEVLSRRCVLRLGAAAFGGALLPASFARAQPAGANIRTTELGAGLFLLQGAGGNVLAMRGGDGALMVDGGLATNADALLRAVFAATGNDKVTTLINTHWHPEQTGANEKVGAAGGTILAHEKTALYLGHGVYSATFEGRLEPLAAPGRPTKTVRAEGSLEHGGRRVDYGYLPAAHTDGDLYVWFPQLNVLAGGGVVSGEKWPLIDYKNGSWFGGRVRALERLASLVKPDTRVVPADGKLITGRDIVRQRDIYDALFTTMIGYMNMGFGPEDAVEHNPLKQYEAEFGDPSAFLDGAYRSMLIAYVPD
jgi:glyoxylase-like metal-dependent hydrolase (beta-lactamase superfamily II)